MVFCCVRVDFDRAHAKGGRTVVKNDLQIHKKVTLKMATWPLFCRAFVEVISNHTPPKKPFEVKNNLERFLGCTCSRPYYMYLSHVFEWEGSSSELSMSAVRSPDRFWEWLGTEAHGLTNGSTHPIQRRPEVKGL